MYSKFCLHKGPFPRPCHKCQLKSVQRLVMSFKTSLDSTNAVVYRLYIKYYNSIIRGCPEDISPHAIYSHSKHIKCLHCWSFDVYGFTVQYMRYLHCGFFDLLLYHATNDIITVLHCTGSLTGSSIKLLHVHAAS